MSTTMERQSNTTLAKAIETLAIIGMGFMALAVVGTVIGRSGLGLSDDIGFGDDAVMSVPAELGVPLDLGDELSTIETSDGTIDEATGRPPVELSGPVTAELNFWSPSATERTVWVLWQVSGPLLAIAGAWQIHRMARSTRLGDPFTAENERRLWTLAAIVAVGGSASLWLGEAARSWLVERSAAADLVSFTFTLSFAPLLIGGVIAMLASIWRVGVALRDDVEGMV